MCLAVETESLSKPSGWKMKKLNLLKKKMPTPWSRVKCGCFIAIVIMVIFNCDIIHNGIAHEPNARPLSPKLYLTTKKCAVVQIYFRQAVIGDFG